jgi:tetratricopeptide (TPR) repeat protein
LWSDADFSHSPPEQPPWSQRQNRHAATLSRRLEQFLPDLRRALATAKPVFDACRYNELTLGLPRIITAAQHTADQSSGQARERVLVHLAEAYTLASELAVKLNQDGMAWVAADRALTAAQRSGDCVAIAVATRGVAIAMRRQGRHDGAVDLLTRGALQLGADAGDPDPEAPRDVCRDMYAAMLCTASYFSAQNGKRARALDLIAEAEQAARRLPDIGQRVRFPSPVNVAVYRIGVHTALGEPEVALEHARLVNQQLLPTAERRARYWVDTARAWEAFGRLDRAAQALLMAERVAPERFPVPQWRRSSPACCTGRAPHQRRCALWLCVAASCERDR